ncbi:MAG TPA: ATP-binding protein [Actinomycetota bacterium]|nr:ATP-binding protein [Actinomycetota bacterium]
MRLRRLRPVEVYVALVSGAGLSLLAWFASTVPIGDVRLAPSAFWWFSVFLVAAELLPIRVPRASEVEEVSTSTTFAFALLLGFGGRIAALSLAVASAIADLTHRKPAWKALFNVGQYTLSVGAARAVYLLLGGVTAFHGEDVVAGDNLLRVAASAATFFVANDALTGIALALAEGQPVLRYLRRDLLFQAATAAALLALSPIVVVAAERSTWLIPLVLLPVAAVYWGATVSLENARLIASLERSLQRLTELNRMKDDFVAVVSHELRTPLTSIQGYLKTLLQLGAELPEDQRRSFLQAADRQGDRLRRLIEQLLVVARLESGAERRAVSWVSLPEVVDHVIDELRPRAHGHTFDVRLEPGVDRVRTDEGKLHQILSNLVENALKYSPPDTRVTVRIEGRPEGVLVTVEDEGPGIPPEHRERVFERFFQGDQSSTRRVGGIGLGLYICRSLSEAIGAKLWIERSGPTGTAFALLLPPAPPGEEDEAPPGEQDETPPGEEAEGRSPLRRAVGAGA